MKPRQPVTAVLVFALSTLVSPGAAQSPASALTWYRGKPNDNFLLLAAEKVTNKKTVHVNTIGISRVIPAQRGPAVTDILQASIDAIRSQDAVPLINHPNFRWAFTAKDMLPLKGTILLEIASSKATFAPESRTAEVCEPGRSPSSCQRSSGDSEG